MITRFTTSIAAWYWRRRNAHRARELRRFYLQQLGASSNSLEQRVQFHIEHLNDYWPRCLGFLALATSPGPSFLAADWVTCITLASDIADPDIRAFARQHDIEVLSVAWAEYSLALAVARRAYQAVRPAIEQAAGAFTRLSAVYEHLRSGLTSA